jgi:hypothetical protein
VKVVRGKIEFMSPNGSIQNKKIQMRLPDDMKKRELKIARIFEYLKIPVPPTKEEEASL